jgi:polyhydroxybutyrate depolymerase
MMAASIVRRAGAMATWLVLGCPADPDAEDGGSTGSSGGDGATTASSTSAPTTSTTAGMTMSSSTEPETTSGSPSTTEVDSSGGGSTDESTGAPLGSAGCGLAAPATGVLSIDVDGQPGEYVLSIPADYDPSQPYPLGFAFHGRNRTGPNCHDGDCAGFQSVMENDAVLVYMTSLGGTGWEGDGEREINVTFFETLLAQLESTVCIDEARVFVAGTSSGAHFTNVLGCRFGDILLAIAPVAGYLPETECVDSVAALVIHGVLDPSFGEGVIARDFWRELDGCSEDTVPTIDEVHASVTATMESHDCAEYQGCDAGVPVTWCEHSEGGYDGSTHGWPLFGGQAIWDFVQSL